MRSIAFLFYALFLGLCVTACGGGHPAENAAVSFFTAAFQGDADKMVARLAGVDSQKESEKNMVKGKMQMMAAASKEHAQKKGGLKKVEIDTEKKTEINKQDATVFVVIHFGDGSTEKETANLIQENGAWKIKL